MKDIYVVGKKMARNGHKTAICPVANFGDQSLATILRENHSSWSKQKINDVTNSHTYITHFAKWV